MGIWLLFFLLCLFGFFLFGVFVLHHIIYLYRLEFVIGF